LSNHLIYPSAFFFETKQHSQIINIVTIKCPLTDNYGYSPMQIERQQPIFVYFSYLVKY